MWPQVSKGIQCLYVYVYMYVYMYVYVYVYVYVYAFVYVFVCVFVCAFAYAFVYVSHRIVVANYCIAHKLMLFAKVHLVK